jgi:putative RecB family exonuclease
VGALDAMAGLPFRVLAVPGLVEGGYPGVFRPDPFLLDSERLALRALAVQDSGDSGGGLVPPPTAGVVGARPRSPLRSSVASSAPSGKPSQLSLFGDPGTPAGSQRGVVPLTPLVSRGSGSPGRAALPTAQDRLVEARRQFHRAVSQATERLILSYPRADARSGRERLPSLFFAAAAATLAGRPVAGVELERLVSEDDPRALALEDAVDPGERDRFRVQRDETAVTAIAAGSPFFQKSRLASQARWSGKLTRYDGWVADEAGALVAALDPLRARHPVSASRLATYARCGFQYLLQHVLRLQPALEPEERRRIDPLERGDLFHRVAEAYLRERRDRGELPVRDSEPLRARLREMAEEALQRLVAGSPPRFTLLWERERRRFHETMQDWLGREAAQAERGAPAHFELSFGLGMPPDAEEPHDPEPLEIELGDGRALRVSGRIDRIDRRLEGGLVLRDYKTGRAPKDDGGVFRGGRQLQIPFYVLAVQKLFPGESVVDAFLDYVDGGRQVAFRPEAVTGPAFRALLRELVDLVARGVFVQEPSACDFCDYTVVCGPKPLLQRRQLLKRRDPQLQAYLRLRDVE